MTVFKRGDIVLIGFPFTDLSGSKQRPALVISANRYNKKRDDIILAAITSHISGNTEEDEYLLSPLDQKLAGLPKQSLVKLGKLVTIDQRLIRKRLGHISSTTQSLIRNILHEIIWIPVKIF